ncbi:MAG: YesL family protein [Clostridia bacterium]|nr:YesL family protein [Clostridia bacterium]
MAGMFGLFNYDKEGPGVSKNAPPKRRFVVFFELYGRKFWKLIWAGLLWLAVSLPIVTRGWADAGLTFITRNFTREKHAFIREDFFETIKKNRWPALAVGIINLIVTGILLYNISLYAFATMPVLYVLLGAEPSAIPEPVELGTFDIVVLGVSMAGYMLFTWMKYYIPFLVITFKLKLKQVYKNAFLFAAVNLKANLIISLVLLLVYGGLISLALFLNYGLVQAVVLLLFLTLVPAFRSFLIQFCIFPAIKKMMIDPYYKENPNADKQARLDLNLEVEEVADPDAPAPVPVEEPVFSDTVPEPDPEPANIPRQYSEREMRRFNNRVRATEDDDDTI